MTPGDKSDMFHKISSVKQGVVSVLNSTTAALGAGEFFTGVGEDVSAFSTITVFVNADEDGTLFMEFSPDGITWPRSKAVPVKQSIGAGSVHTLEVVSKFFRTAYDNNLTVAQKNFALQTIFHIYKSGFLTTSLNEQISKINDAQLSRTANDVILDISRDLYADKAAIRKFGCNTAVPNGSFADIWAYGPTDPSYNWPITDEVFRVQAGGNVADTLLGAGARTVQVIYLDANGDSQQEQLQLGGVGVSSPTSLTGRRFQRAWVDSVGTILSNNVGDIIFENATTGDVVGLIPAGFGETLQTMFTVPRANQAYLRQVDLNIAIGANKDADIKMWQRRDAYTIAAPFGTKRLVKEWSAIQGPVPTPFDAFPSFPALTDIWFEGQGNGAITIIDIDYALVCIVDETISVPQ